MSRSPVRVLLIINRYPLDETPGCSPGVVQQQRALQQLGYEMDLLYVDSQRSLLLYLWAMAQVFFACQVRKRYDLVHAHYG